MLPIALPVLSPNCLYDHRDDARSDNPGREAACRVARLDEGAALPRVRRHVPFPVGFTLGFRVALPVDRAIGFPIGFRLGTRPATVAVSRAALLAAGRAAVRAAIARRIGGRSGGLTTTSNFWRNRKSRPALRQIGFPTSDVCGSVIDGSSCPALPSSSRSRA